MPFIPHTEEDTEEMLAVIGAERIENAAACVRAFDDHIDQPRPELRLPEDADGAETGYTLA